MNKRITVWALAVLAMCAVWCIPSFSYALDIKKEKLSNGLTVLYVERHELPIVMATMLIKASPLQESAEKAGTAYITSKMLSQGTATRKATDISREIDFIGASLDTAVNDDFTTVSLSVLKKDVDKGFDLFSDTILKPSFPADELARRKELLKGSLKQKEEDPSFVASKEFTKDIFGDFTYGRRVEGTLQSIGGIDRANVLNFYGSFYRPENAILTVVGDLSREELDKLLNRTFALWKTPEAASGSKVELKSPPVLKGPRVEVIDKDVTQASILFGYVGIARNNSDYYAVQVMNYIFGGGGFSSRLMNVIRDEMGLTYSINSLFAATKYPGRFEVEVQTKNESAGRVIDEMLKQMRLMKAQSISDQELRDAKDYLIGSFPRRLETIRKTADFIAAVQYYRLGDDYIDRYKYYVAKVTKDDVLRIARKYLDDENYVIVIVGNKKKLVLGNK